MCASVLQRESVGDQGQSFIGPLFVACAAVCFGMVDMSKVASALSFKQCAIEDCVIGS